MSRSLNLNEVEPRLATRTSMGMNGECQMQNAECPEPNSSFDIRHSEFRSPRRLTGGQRKGCQQIRMRSRDDVRCNEFAHLASRFCAGVNGGANAAHIAA